MKESIKTEVIIRDEEKELEILCENETIYINIEGKELCCLDWVSNFKPMLERMMELWGDIEEQDE